MATKNLIIRGGADFSGVKKEMQKTQQQLEKFKNNVGSTMKKIGAILGTIAVGGLVKDSTQLAMTVESSLDNIARNMGKSAESFQNWAETQSKAFGMGMADAYQYGSTFSNLLSSFSASAEETAKNTQDLMEAAAIIANKTGRTFEDTAERIRSGLLGSTEAIEDLGVYVNVSMIESTEAFRRFAGDKSWAQLDYQTQQQIRLAAILEQTYARYGNTLADTTQTRHAQFLASLQNIKLSLGQAFLPIYNAVLPALTAMANAIGKVVNVIAQFTQALFGKAPVKQAEQTAQAVTQQATAVDDLSDSIQSAGSTAKKTQSQLAGFDEIRNIKTSTGSDSSGGLSSGTDGLSSLAMPTMDTTDFTNSTIEVSGKIQKMADKIKSVFNNLKNTIVKNKDEITAAIAGITVALVAYKAISNWGTAVAGLSKAFKALKLAIAGISVPALIVAAVIGALVAGIVYLWKTNEGFRERVIKIWEGIKAAIGTAISAVLDFIKDMGAKISRFWKENGEQILEAVENVFNGIMKVVEFVMPFVLEIVKSIWGAIKNIISGALDAIMGLIKIFAGLFTGDWKKMWEGVKQLLSGVLQAIWGLFQLQIIGKLLGGIRSFISSGINLFKSFFTNAKNIFTNLFSKMKSIFGSVLSYITGTFKSGWKRAWNGVKSIFSNVFSSLYNIVKWPINKIISGFNTLIRGLNRISIKIPSWVPGFGGKRFGISIPQIPRLAQGGYIGANSPVLAMIGDNRNEGEIVAPESKIYEQTFQAVSDAISQSNGNPVELVVNIAGNNVFRGLIDGINKAQRQAGKTLLEV